VTERIRPWDHAQCIEHYRDLGLARICSPTPKRILDIGFGKERRSTLALRAIFEKPTTQIVAIDNDLTRFAGEYEALTDRENKVQYLFSDVDLLEIPGGRKYDLVVFCMSLFCLQNPLRAIGTVASRALKRGGQLLITQRNDPVLRALCDIEETSSNTHADSETVERIRKCWTEITNTAKEGGINLQFPWRFRLVCEHEPLFGFLKDIGFEDVTATGHGKPSGDYKVLIDPAHAETFGSVLGGQEESQEPQYSKMKWAWHQFNDKAMWPDFEGIKDVPLGLKHITLSSRVFRLMTDEVAVSNHPFSTYTAPLKIVPTVWFQSGRIEEADLEHKAEDKVGDWITNCASGKSIKAFYLLSPLGVEGRTVSPKPLTLYDDGVVPLEKSESLGTDELALLNFLESNKSASVVIQFYLLNSKAFWPETAASSIFLKKAASPVQMLVFPIYVSGNEDDDIKEIRMHVKELEKAVDTTGVADTDSDITSVARYLNARGKWMQKNGAYGIYYYYRQNPSADKKPVARGASILVTEALPIETTIEFLIMAEEVIGNYQSQRYVHALQQRVEFEEKAGKAGILVRNLSHHIGSHVLVNRQNSVKKALTPQQEGQEVDYRKAARNLIDDSKFYTYIRERMEFLAMLSLDAQLWSMPARVGDLFAFLEHELDSAILRDNIGANEGVKFAEVSAPKDVADEIIALPWGTTGLHAFYTLVEGLLRNACKHGHITTPMAHLEVQVEKPERDTDPIWLYCGVPEQTVSAGDAAKAILQKMMPDKDISDDPIEKLNGLLSKPLQITRPEGGYAHGALGIMEMAIAAKFLSCDEEACLQARDSGGRLFMGFKLTRPKGMYKINPEEEILPKFRYDYESYLAECDMFLSQEDALPQFPLGPRTLYVSDSKCDDEHLHRYARISRAEWESSKQDDEAIAKQLLRTRHNAEDFRVVIVGKSPWRAAWSWDQSAAALAGMDFIDENTSEQELKTLVVRCGSNNSRTLVLAHGRDQIIIETERKKQPHGGRNIVVLGISDGDQICRQYVAACVRQCKWNALRLLLWEAAFLKYEIYDDRIYSQFYEKNRGLIDGEHIALLREACIDDLAGGRYAKDVMRIIHVSPWNEAQKKFKNLDWESFYPNIVFHSARGGDVITTGKWDFPRLDYSSVVRALESGTAGNKMDSLIRLALLTQRVGCSPSKPS
jgi:SAM-dependent methyltransferase